MCTRVQRICIYTFLCRFSFTHTWCKVNVGLFAIRRAHSELTGDPPIGHVLGPPKDARVNRTPPCFCETSVFLQFSHFSAAMCLSFEGSASGENQLTVRFGLKRATFVQRGHNFCDIGSVAAKVCLMLNICWCAVNRRQNRRYSGRSNIFGDPIRHTP